MEERSKGGRRGRERWVRRRKRDVEREEELSVRKYFGGFSLKS